MKNISEKHTHTYTSPWPEITCMPAIRFGQCIKSCGTGCDTVFCINYSSPCFRAREAQLNFLENIFIYFSDQDMFVDAFVFVSSLSLSLSPSVLMASGVEIQDVDHLLVQTTTNYYIWFCKNLIMKMKSLSPALPPMLLKF